MNAIQAIKKALKITSKVEFFEGYINFEGVRLPVGFHAPVGATIAEKDAAFLAALAQQAEINYLSIGTVDAIDIGTVLANQNERGTRDEIYDMEMALKPWTDDLCHAGAREGWVLSHTSGAEEAIQCQAIDSPEDWIEAVGVMPPVLENDAAAWRVLMAGTQPHHLVAKEILAKNSPIEWSNMNAEHAKASDISASRLSVIH